MNQTWVRLWLAIWLSASGAIAAQDHQTGIQKSGSAQQELAPRFLHWLDMVSYIASAEEKEVFQMLQNDRDRDGFVKLFWQQRDPTPGTPENEFKSEIEKRFEFVNRRFNRGSSRPGWTTDMGRFYMILGEPKSIERFDENPELFPIQVWYYAGDPAVGLPAYFNITFFRPQGSGNWKLYNPSLDGPAALLNVSHRLDETQYDTIMEKIKKIAPTLAGPALSMIANDTSSGNRPSVQNAIILSQILESPTRQMSATYATNYLKYKGFVNVELSTSYIESIGLVALVWEPRWNCALAEFSVKPKKITLDYNAAKDVYYFNLKLNVGLRQGDKFVYQYVKNFEFSFPPDRVESLHKNGLVIHDYFPVVPGHFQVTVFVENSVSREFSFFDRPLTVPEDASPAQLATPLLGFQSEEESDQLFHAMRFGNRKLCLDPQALFGSSETPLLMASIGHMDRELWEKGKIELDVSGLSERTPFHQSRVIALRDTPFAPALNIFYPLAGLRLAPDFYRITLRLINSAGVKTDTKETDFGITMASVAAHPIESYKSALALQVTAQLDFARGMQFENVGQLTQAEGLYAHVLELTPGFAEGRLQYMRLQNRQKNFAKTLAASEPLRGLDKTAFEFHALRGAAFFGLEQYDAALAELHAASRLYNSDVRVLNLIGFASLKKNDRAEALRAFSASLTLLADQPDISKQVAALRGIEK